MSIYTDIRDGVFEFTNRTDLTAETDAAIRQAVRTAHKAGSFWRDLVELNLTGQDTTEALQTIDLSVSAPSFKQLAHIGPTDSNVRYTPVDIKDLLDPEYKVFKTDVCYGMGTNLVIRPAAASEDITMVYWAFPTVSPIADLDSWIASKFPDLIICWASATVLTLIGEQEIKTRVEALAKLEYQALIADNLQIQRS